MIEETLPKFQVGPQGPIADGQYVFGRGGPHGEQVVQQLHGQYYEAVRRGNVYIAYTAVAGVVLPIYSNTTQLCAVWNKSLTKNLVPIKLAIGNVGTPAVSGNLGLAMITGAGTAPATGAPISAFTEANPINAKTLQAASGQAGRFCSTATVIAPTIFFTLGFTSAGVLAAASTTTPWVKLEHEFNGSLIIPPGAAICVCGNVAQTAAFDVSISWEEVDA